MLVDWQFALMSTYCLTITDVLCITDVICKYIFIGSDELGTALLDIINMMPEMSKKKKKSRIRKKKKERKEKHSIG